MTELRHILVVADIEGGTGCWSYRASQFLNPEWARACRGMSLDVAAVTEALFESGAAAVTIKDFHRTGYNLLPELIDARAVVDHGYRDGPVPGMGTPPRAEAAFFLGMHAASGTTGFLAHTLTSRIAALEVNGRPLTEVELFSASLAPYGLAPVFFSGDAEACRQAVAAIPGLVGYPLDKSAGPENIDADHWRKGLAHAAVSAKREARTGPYHPSGPFRVRVTMRDGAGAAGTIARRWGLEQSGADLVFEAKRFPELYRMLLRVAYLTPALERMLPLGLWAYRWMGRLGLAYVRRCLKKGVTDGSD